MPLGNGQGLQRPQDHAPAVVSWAWPSSEALIDGVTEDQREMIRAAVSSSDYKASQKAKNWVGQAVAYAVGLDLEDEASRKRAGSIAKAMLKEGVLVEREGRDQIRRETAMFVRAA
ncbi:ATPase [Rhizobium sp. A37_96]